MKERGSGRLAETRLEERETDRLKKDEIITGASQKDEINQCYELEKAVDDMITLAKLKDNDFYFKTSGIVPTIRLQLRKLREEKMSLNEATLTFSLLHAALVTFLSQISRGFEPVDKQAEKIEYIQKRYYADLITEMKMEKDEKRLLTTMVRQVLAQERGRGQLKAA